ncbi:MAG: glycosyltransferase family 4 protein [Opitutaceae bacterium]|jgi:glycosyltransferase involved in cell wall biosynthesis
MNILFICYSDFRSNSLLHIAGFAAGMHRRGHACVVAVPQNAGTITAVPAPMFRPLLYADILKQPACFPDGRSADIIHAWTPRHHVADCVIAYQRRLSQPARLVVHLEDNEEFLAEHTCGLSFADLRKAEPFRWRALMRHRLIHPWRYRLLLHASDAVTHITPTLARFVPEGRTAALLRPGVDRVFFEIGLPAPALRRQLGLPAEAKIIVYPGGANPFNVAELRELYQAVVQLNHDGCCVRLIRTGKSPAWFVRQLTPDECAVSLDLGFVDRLKIPGLLALADVLVQPGQSGPFNDYRLPSKLAEFLASGKPVVMPATNIAGELVDGRDALFLREGTPDEIAALCRRIFDAPDFAAELGRNGRDAARRLFDENHQSELLAAVYDRVAAAPVHVPWTELADLDRDERALFSAEPADADLAAALQWLQRQPVVPACNVWRRAWRSLLGGLCVRS